MREDQYKVLAVGVDHAEGQLIIVVAAEKRIIAHIAQKIIHPAHVPLIIKAQALILYVACDLRPGRGFLCDQYRAVPAALKHGI